jgi:PAS domain S-box-containing protein
MELGALYQGIVEASLDGVWVFDGAGRTLYANRAVADLLGVDESELVALTLFDPLDEVGRAQMAAHLEDLAEGRVNESEVECLWHRRDGEQVWVLVRESTLYDEHGTVQGYLHSISDYSDRRRLFEEVQQSRTMLAEAQRIAKVGSWEWDLRRGRISASDELHAIYAIPREDFGGSFDAFMDLVHADDRSTVDAAVQAALEGEDAFEFEARVHRGDASTMWIRGRGEVFRDPHGEPVWARGTHQDISDVKRSALALQDLLAQNTLMQAVATAANEAETLAEVLGVGRSLLIDHDDWVRGVAFVLDPDRPGAVVALDPDVEPYPRERRIAVEVMRRRGQVWDEETDPQSPAIGFPLVVAGEAVAVLVVTASTPFERHEMIRGMIEHAAVQLGRVAEREKAARELAAARDAAMAASRQKSEFLAAMSHEIRTPLNGVIGLNDLLLRTELDAHQHRLAAGAQVASRALLAVINDILDFSKIEAGKLELESVDFEVRAVFDQVASVLAESARSKGLELLVSCHPDVPDWLNGDPTRLAQVLTNLGSNAVKFTPEGEVSIRAVVHADDDGSVVLRVEVVDDGVGVEPEKLEHIFAPFTQADSSTTRQYGGTGLGLAISSEIVAALGGQIGADSEPGKGSSFWFTARFARARRRATEPAAGPARDALAGRTVLVVDDNANNRLILGEHLGRWQAVATSADSVPVALEHLRAAAEAGRPVDAVLLDLAMPDLDGMDLAALVRADERLAGTPLIMLTSMDGPPDATLRDAGIVECLTKPVLARDVHEALVRALGSLPDEHPRRQNGPARTGEPSGVRPRLLVVEDNDINQLVALGILETLGYAADTADDGEQAVGAWRDGSYAAVLMDVQMPRMDGYAATRAIRALEPEGERVPVLAMTAAAVEGEREKCLAAGMDDFLTKPVDPQALGAMLQRWVHDAEDGRQVPTQVRDGDGVLDLDRLDMLRDLDPTSTAYLDRAIANFVARGPESVGTIRRAVVDGNAEALTQAAHRLKGSALNLGMPAVGHLAYELEMLGDGGGSPVATDLLDSLEEALAQAVGRVREYQRSYQGADAL